MKTIPTIAMTFALALSLPACTATTSHPTPVKSSVMVGNPAVVLRHPFHQLERDGAPKPIPVSANSEPMVVAETTNEIDPSVIEKTPNTPASMGHLLVSILGEIAVACVTYGHCT